MNTEMAAFAFSDRAICIVLDWVESFERMVDFFGKAIRNLKDFVDACRLTFLILEICLRKHCSFDEVLISQWCNTKGG